jgi:hypothetical protein
MKITRGGITKNLTLYPPTKPSPTFVYPKFPPPQYPQKDLAAPLTQEEFLELKKQLEDGVISGFINNLATMSNLTYQMLQVVLDYEAQADLLEDLMEQQIPTTTIHNSKPIEIAPGRSLSINVNLDEQQQQKIIQVLSKYQQDFAWEYSDMKGIDPQLCTHHIYVEIDVWPIRKPQRRLNPHLRDIVKEELQKLLDVDFIYPISDSRWVSPLVIVPKKNGKWHICVDYRELNKDTQKDHFPLPFIDQVLDTLAGKKLFSFLDGFSGYNQIQISPEDQYKTTFTCPWGTFAYRVLPFGLCNTPFTFQRAILSIFINLISKGLEVSMDDFTPYGNDFDQALNNLEKIL